MATLPPRPFRGWLERARGELERVPLRKVLPRPPVPLFELMGSELLFQVLKTAEESDLLLLPVGEDHLHMLLVRLINEIQYFQKCVISATLMTCVPTPPFRVSFLKTGTWH